MKNSLAIGIICQLIATAIFSFHYVAAQKLLQAIDPLALIALRGSIGGIIVYFCYKLFYKVQISWNRNLNLKSAFFLVLMILLGFGCNQLLFIKGLILSSAGQSALLGSSLPLLIYGLAIMFRQEKWDKHKFISMVVGFSAITIYLSHQYHFHLTSGAIGGLYILAAFICLAASLLISKNQMQHLSPALVSSITLTYGGIFVAIIAQPDLTKALSISFSNSEFILLFLFEVVITALAWFLNFTAIKILGTSNASAINFLQIPITASLAYLYLGQIPNIYIIPLTLILVPASWIVISKSR